MPISDGMYLSMLRVSLASSALVIWSDCSPSRSSSLHLGSASERQLQKKRHLGCYSMDEVLKFGGLQNNMRSMLAYLTKAVNVWGVTVLV